MAAKGQKKQAGATEKRTVLQLQPVKYQIAFWYLGHDRIQHDAANYRCKYELQRGETAITTKPDRIANQVAGDDNREAAEKAAKPSSKGGDYTNPPVDQVYRVMITDNHGMRSADEQPPAYGLLGDGGAPDGNNISKPVNYAQVDGANKRDWLPDVRPAVPFRVVVRKFIGDTQVDMDVSKKVVVEVKDPVEEFEANDTAPRRFLRGFFAKYNRENKNPDVGDDNAITTFKGLRPAAGGSPGVKAVDVLKKAAYADPPKIDQAPAGTNNVTFASLQAATAHETNNAIFDLTEVDDNGNKVGVSEVVFFPTANNGGPCGGDNYRFLLTLVDSGGKDVRETEENGIPAKLLDDARRELPKPRAYTTGRFVIWRRIKIRLCVLVNRTTQADITWATISGIYRKAFIEVVAPDNPGGFYNLIPVQWIEELKTRFPADAADLEAIKTAAAPNDLNTIYGGNFFPPVLTNKYNWGGGGAGGLALSDQVEPLTRAIINHACQWAIPAVPTSPDSAAGRRQEDPDGFFIVLIRRPAPGVTTMGASFGDRMFWFVNRDSTVANDVASTSSTCAHELGHAVYLRHALTSQVAVGYQAGAAPAGGIAPNIRLVDGTSNCYLQDHDQADAFACLMGYTRPLTAELCGVCALTVRFYDRVEVQRAGNYQNEIHAGLGPVTIVRQTNAPPGPQLSETIPNLTVAAGALHSMLLLAVGPQRNYTDRSGTARLGRVNITHATPCNWTANPAGRVTVAASGGAMRVTAVAAGNVTLRFTKGNLAAEVNFQVV